MVLCGGSDGGTRSCVPDQGLGRLHLPPGGAWSALPRRSVSSVQEAEPGIREREEEVYLERAKTLRESLDQTEETPSKGPPAERAVEWLRAVGETWQAADVPEEKADLLHAIYERITVTGRSLVGVRLTREAYAHGLALALPEVVMARPTGVGRALATYEIPIEGIDEWLALLGRQSDA